MFLNTVGHNCRYCSHVDDMGYRCTSKRLPYNKLCAAHAEYYRIKSRLPPVRKSRAPKV